MQNYDKKYYTKANSRRQIVGIERMKQFCNIDCFILLIYKFADKMLICSNILLLMKAAEAYLIV